MTPRGNTSAEIRALRRALDGLRRALRQDDQARLADLATRLSEHCDRIEAATLTRAAGNQPMLAALRDEAATTLRELGARLAGLRAAQALIVAARSGGGDVFYGPGGQRQTLAPHAGKLERRR